MNATMAMKRLLLLAALVLAAAPARAGEPGPSSGPEILQPFKQQLQQALQEGLARGPAEAIEACRVRAPEIAASLSREGIRVGRTSHRLRNPANSAPAWVEPVLERYLANPGDRAPREVDVAPGRAGYVEPILTQALCLTCHGDAIAPDISARLSKLYPEDEAVGFELGELRGVFWVEMPAAW